MQGSTNPISLSTVELNTPESWKRAKTYAKAIGYLPIAFTSTVRLLIVDELKYEAKMRPVTKYQVARIFKSASFKSMLYHASIFLHPEKLEDQQQIHVGDMMNLYKPLDLAALIGLFVLFKKCRRSCDELNWDRVFSDMAAESQISAAVGVGIPSIGLGANYLGGTVKHLALIPFIMQDASKYDLYRAKLLGNEGVFDHYFETESWGCSSAQVGSMLLSALGFGIDAADALFSGIDPQRQLAFMEQGLPYRIKMGALWTEAVRKLEAQPYEQVRGEYYPMQKAREIMDKQIQKVGDGALHWMMRGADDISPELTPALFDDDDSQAEFEIPEELKDVFSLEEITSMKENEFDQLIDQIDHEQAGEMLVGNESFSTSDLAKIEEMLE